MPLEILNSTDPWRKRVKSVLNTIFKNSGSEVDTGRTWFDGTTIYRKIINIGALPNTTTKTVAHGISSLNLVLSISGFAKRASDSVTLPLPRASDVDNRNVDIFIDPTNISIITGADQSAFSTSYITLEYTKS